MPYFELLKSQILKSMVPDKDAEKFFNLFKTLKETEIKKITDSFMQHPEFIMKVFTNYKNKEAVKSSFSNQTSNQILHEEIEELESLLYEQH